MRVRLHSLGRAVPLYVLLAACSTHPSAQISTSKPPASNTVILHSSDGAGQEAGGSLAQLDKSLSYDGMRRVLHGVVVDGGHAAAAPAGAASPVVTDFRFRVLDQLGARPGRDLPTSLILRVPGGTSGGQRVVAEGAPALSNGAELYVYDQVTPVHGLAGGPVAGVVVLDNQANFASVRGAQVQWLHASFSKAVFEQHIRSQRAKEPTR